MGEAVTFHRRGCAAIVALNRPQVMNAWDAALGADLLAAIQTCEEDDAIRAVCLTGTGSAFSSGADLRGGLTETSSAGHLDLQRLLVDLYHPIIVGVRRLEKPVVAAVNGPAVGIGAALALACDLVVAAESAYFMLAFVNLGLVPDGGLSSFVASRVGFARASELALLGERLPASRALAWGLVNRVWPDAELAVEVDAFVDRLAAGPTRAYAATKRQLNAWLYGSLEAQMHLEADLQQGMAGTADFAEGLTAFLEKRTAEFRGA